MSKPYISCSEVEVNSKSKLGELEKIFLKNRKLFKRKIKPKYQAFIKDMVGQIYGIDEVGQATLLPININKICVDPQWSMIVILLSNGQCYVLGYTNTLYWIQESFYILDNVTYITMSNGCIHLERREYDEKDVLLPQTVQYVYSSNTNYKYMMYYSPKLDFNYEKILSHHDRTIIRNSYNYQYYYLFFNLRWLYLPLFGMFTDQEITKISYIVHISSFIFIYDGQLYRFDTNKNKLSRYRLGTKVTDFTFTADQNILIIIDEYGHLRINREIRNLKGFELFNDKIKFKSIDAQGCTLDGQTIFVLISPENKGYLLHQTLSQFIPIQLNFHIQLP